MITDFVLKRRKKQTSHHGAVGNPKLTYRSLLERDAIYVLLLCADIELVSTQSKLLVYRDAEGNERKYRADVYFRWKGRDCLAEVKPSEVLRRPDMVTKYSTIGRSCRQGGYGFVCITSDQICQEPRRSIARHLRGYQRHRCPPESIESLLRFVREKNEPVPIGALVRNQLDVAVAYWLICQGRLRFVDFKAADLGSSTIAVGEPGRHPWRLEGDVVPQAHWDLGMFGAVATDDTSAFQTVCLDLSTSPPVAIRRLWSNRPPLAKSASIKFTHGEQYLFRGEVFVFESLRLSVGNGPLLLYLRSLQTGEVSRHSLAQISLLIRRAEFSLYHDGCSTVSQTFGDTNNGAT